MPPYHEVRIPFQRRADGRRRRRSDLAIRVSQQHAQLHCKRLRGQCTPKVRPQLSRQRSDLLIRLALVVAGQPDAADEGVGLFAARCTDFGACVQQHAEREREERDARIMQIEKQILGRSKIGVENFFLKFLKKKG